MADAGPRPPTRGRTGLWIGAAFGLLLTLQAGPTLAIVYRDGLSGSFDRAGFIGYSLGSIFVPLLIGCLGLLIRRNRGLGYFVVSLAVFLIAEIGRLAV